MSNPIVWRVRLVYDLLRSADPRPTTAHVFEGFPIAYALCGQKSKAGAGVTHDFLAIAKNRDARCKRCMKKLEVR